MALARAETRRDSFMDLSEHFRGITNVERFQSQGNGMTVT